MELSWDPETAHRIENIAGIPSNADISIARRMIVLVEEKIDELNSNIHKMTNQLRKERVRLQRLRAVTSTQKRIPPEVLVETFLYAYSLNNHHESSVLSPSYLKSVPWTLRSVCSTWRHVALSEYKLWNNLVFRFHQDVSPALMTHPRLHRLLSFVNRSIVIPSRPVSITIDQTSRSPGLPHWFNEGIILPNLSQLVCLHLTMVPVAIRETLEGLPKSPPLLKTLVLEAIHDKEYPVMLLVDFDIPLFCGTPMFQEFKVYSHAVRQLFLGCPSTTWHHLTCLEILGDKYAVIDLVSAASFLRQCPNISTCILRLRFHPQVNLIHPSSPLLLSHLRVLTLQDFEGLSEYSNICPLIAPLLTDLSVAAYDARSKVGYMVPWIITSTCSLQHLSFHGPSNPWVSVQKIASDELLATIPEIRHLDIRNTFYPDETLQRLGDGYLPHLSSLTLCGNLRTARTMADTLELRKGTGADCMQTFSLYINDSRSHRRELLQCVERAKACNTTFRIHDYNLGWLDELTDEPDL